MKGGGLGRMQQRFNAAVVTVLALAGLRGMAGTAETAKDTAAKGFGHPLHRKLIKGKIDGCPAELHLTHRAHCSHYDGDAA